MRMPVDAIVEPQLTELKNLCRQFYVERLDLFGSAATGGFSERASDLDFLVTFGRTESMTRSDQYFGLLEALERLFQRRIDLVTHQSRRNPYFIQATNASGVNLYAS